MLRRREVFQGALVTGELNVPVHGAGGEPHQGVKPVEGPHPQGQGLAEDVPAAEVGELVEEGKPQGVPGGRVLRKKKGGPEQESRRGRRSSPSWSPRAL